MNNSDFNRLLRVTTALLANKDLSALSDTHIKQVIAVARRVIDLTKEQSNRGEKCIAQEK